MRAGKRHKVLVFGNPVLAIDSMPLLLMPDLRKMFPNIEFKDFDPNDNLEEEGRSLNIIDTVQGIGKVTLLTEDDIMRLEVQRIYSMHDFDLAHSLKLLRKLHAIDRVRIFGVPMRISRADALLQLSAMISSILP